MDILPASQRSLWSDLASVPKNFVLYGGTAIALRLGHRTSVAFDFFSSDPLDRRALDASVSFLAGAQVLQEQPDALTVSVDRGGPIKVSFFGPIDFGRVGEPQPTTDGVVRVASLLDLSATKIKVLLQRIESKDYLDLAALLREGVSLEKILSAARTLFGETFNPLVAQKALAFFEGGDLSSLDPKTRDLLTAESVREFVVTQASCTSSATSSSSLRSPRLTRTSTLSSGQELGGEGRMSLLGCEQGPGHQIARLCLDEELMRDDVVQRLGPHDGGGHHELGHVALLEVRGGHDRPFGEVLRGDHHRHQLPACGLDLNVRLLARAIAGDGDGGSARLLSGDRHHPFRDRDRGHRRVGALGALAGPGVRRPSGEELEGLAGPNRGSSVCA